MPGTIRAERAVRADSCAGAVDAGKASVGDSLNGRGRDVMDHGSQRSGRIRRMTITDWNRPRGEACVRGARVMAARARIAAGFYDRADVREKLLDAILDELLYR